MVKLLDQLLVGQSMGNIDVLADCRHCKEVGDESDCFDNGFDIRLPFYSLVIPRCHAKSHFVSLIFSAKLAACIIIKTLVDLRPSLEGKIYLVAYIG